MRKVPVVFQRTAKKCTKSQNARAQPLFCSLNLLFSDVLVPVAVVVILGPVHTKTIVNANASKRKLFYAFRPSEDDENAHRKRINSKTLSKVDKFENAVYASSCGRP